MKSIHLLIPYFGKLPNWFPLFLKSCGANPTIQFNLFGDDAAFDHLLPRNFKRHPMNLAQFNLASSQAIGSHVKITSTRKVCDFKPMLGLIFQQHLENADFWGYCDIDLIFGNIRQFVTTQFLNEYDVISSGDGFLAGHFSIFRNSEKTRLLFERSKDIESVLTSERCLVFDELGPSAKWHFPGFTIDSDGSIEAMTQLVSAARDSGDLRVLLGLPIVNDPDQPFRDNYSLRWTNLGLFDNERGTEYLYIHFQSSKGRFGFRRLLPTANTANNFDISELGFFSTFRPSATLKHIICILHRYYSKLSK